MNTSLVLMEKLISMMIIAGVGFLTIRIGFLEERDTQQFAKLTMYVLGPCLIISAFRIELTPERIRGYLLAMIFAVAAHLIFIAAAAVLRRTRLFGMVEEMSVIYTNCGYLILPIISMTMGQEMVFYGSAYQLTFNLFFWTHGACRMQGTIRIDWKKLFLNPNILAIIAGAFFLFSGISLPGPVDTAVEMLAGAVGPLSMIVIGMSLAKDRLLQSFDIKKAFLVALVRLIALPLIVMAALYACGFLTRHPEYLPVVRISFLAIAAPPAGNVVQLAVLYDRKPATAGVYNMLGNLLCVLTIPLIDALLMAVF